MPTVLRHAIGKTTFKEGFAIPRDFEEWISAPGKGCKREIRLMFDDQTISATLRRIDNEQGSVQVKYDNSEGKPFRAWLETIFTESLSGTYGDYFELSKISEDVFQVSSFPSNTKSIPSLEVSKWLFHRGADKLFEQDTPLAEIPAVVHSIPFINHEGQSFYNKALLGNFVSWNWRSESRVIPELGLKCDFSKDDVQLEVEFGNARTYYQDFIKFLLGNHFGGVKLGILVVPTATFAKHLCEVGRLRAVKKGRRQYSGMIDFEKVHREFHYLEFMLSMPIAIAGIDHQAF